MNIQYCSPYESSEALYVQYYSPYQSSEALSVQYYSPCQSSEAIYKYTIPVYDFKYFQALSFGLFEFEDL